MPITTNVVQIFLSSPNDVQHERNLILEWSEEWNRVNKNKAGCMLSILSSDLTVAPGIADRAQSVVNLSVGQDYDVYLSVMWCRFGTPTGKYESGTAEEFKIALERYKAGEEIEIGAIFKTSSIDLDQIEPQQLVLVRNFMTHVGEEGCFYREFSDEDGLKSIIELFFNQIALRFGKHNTKAADNIDRSRSKELTVLSKQSSTASVNDLSDEGLFEVGEKFEITSRLLNDVLNNITAEEHKNAAILDECGNQLSELAQFSTPDQAAIKTILRRGSTSMESVSSHIDTALPQLEQHISEMIRLINSDLKIRLEFDDPRHSASSTIEGLRSLSDAISTANAQLDSLIRATSKLPRLSSELTKAKRIMLKSRTTMQTLFAGLKDSIENSLAFFANAT